MRFRLVILLSLALTVLLVLPAVSAAQDATARVTDSAQRASQARTTAVHGEPWTGSYLLMVPSALQWTKVRTVWADYLGLFNTWADGYDPYPSSSHVVLPKPSISGNVTVTSWGFGFLGDVGDPDHSQDVIGKCTGHAQLNLTAGDGKKAIRLQFEAWTFGSGGKPNYPYSPIYSRTVTLDTHRPVTIAPYPRACRSGGYVTFTYQVRDNLSPTLKVSIRIANSSGATVKTIALGSRPNKTLLNYLWKCSLTRGKYRYYVLATDLAGNKASQIGSNSLTVR